MNYIDRAVELSRASFDAGQFPAGAVLVSKNGTVYESSPSLPHNHGETMVVDRAIEAEGAPLLGAVVYSSMQPCLMCSAKMYWAGIEKVEYVIPKSAVNISYAYENSEDTQEIAKGFWKPLVMTPVSERLEEALAIYHRWVEKIESK